MPLFKDTVALEACPAKTAESISYAATFAVLGWLVLSNYSVFGASEEVSVSAAEQASNPAPLSLGGDETLLADSQAPSDMPDQAYAASQELREAPLPEFVPWHVSLDLHQSDQIRSRLKALPADHWQQPKTGPIKVDTALSSLYLSDLALPLIDLDLINPAQEGADLASNDAQNGPAIQEITVTSTASERLNMRPDNINRPQLPRPIRANEIQRSLILPPRIQALRP